MKKQLLFILLCPILAVSQIQIGGDIDGEMTNDRSGIVSISNDGSIVAVGAFFNDGNGSNSGHVRIYEKTSDIWVQVGSDINGEAANDQLGGAVSLSGDGRVVAIGAKRNDGNGDQSGHVRVYGNITGNWVQIGEDIDGEGMTDLSGTSVSLSDDGSILAIGAELNDDNGEDSGHVRVYENQAGNWVQLGSDIDGEAAGDKSGFSVSLSSDGTIVAIGAYSNQGNGPGSGHVRVYQNQGGAWIQLGSDIDGEAPSDLSGTSVSLSNNGNIVAIGAKFNDGSGFESGHVRVFEILSGIWTQIGNDIDGEATDDNSGESVSISGDGSIIAIGAGFNEGNGVASGHVRIYRNQSGAWVQVGNDIDGEAVVDVSGISVSLSNEGNTVAIGALLNDGNGENSGHVRVYDLTSVLSSDEFVAAQFKMFPNPASNQFTIQLNDNTELQKVNIYNTIGQFITSVDKRYIDTSQFTTGVYYVEIITSKGKATKKLILK